MIDDAFTACTSSDEKVKQVFAEQSAKDWEDFLLLRCKELVPGG